MRLFESSAGLFARYGFQKTSINDITRAAGVSKGSMYLEFPSKEALFQALIRHEFRAYLAEAAEQIAADPEGGRLSRIYHHCIQALLDREFLRALYTQESRDLTRVMSQRGPEQYHPRVLLGTSFIERMQRAGLIRSDYAPDVLSHLLSILMLGPMLAEPLLHGNDSPPLAETSATLSWMITNSFETTSAGDLAEGKGAFADLVRTMDSALADPVPETGSGDEAPGDALY